MTPARTDPAPEPSALRQPLARPRFLVRPQLLTRLSASPPRREVCLFAPCSVPPAGWSLLASERALRAHGASRHLLAVFPCGRASLLWMRRRARLISD
jgi:hypothetical protein